MSTILNSFKAKFPDVQKVFVTGALSDLLATVRRIGTQTKQRLGGYESLLNTLVNNPDIISDYQAENGVLEIDNVSDGVTKISADTAETMLATITYTKGALSNGVVQNEKFTYATDSAGRVFCFRPYDPELMTTEDASYTPVIVYANLLHSNVVTRSQCLIYLENDQYYLNTLLIPDDRAGSIFEHFKEKYAGRTLVSIFNTFGWSIGTLDETSDLGWWVRRFLVNTEPSFHGDTREEALSYFNEKYGTKINLIGVFGSELIGKSADIGVFIKTCFMSQIKSGCTTLFSFTSDLMSADAINQAITSVCDLVTKGKANVSEIYSLVSSALVSKFNSVKQFCSGVTQAWNRGGIRGALMFIISWFASPKEWEISENGTIQFTDAASFMPKEYIAGLILSVLSTVSQIATTVLLYCGQVLFGAIAAVTTTVFETIKRAITSAKDDTYASISNSDFVIEQCAPFAVYQFSIRDAANFAQICNDQGVHGCIIHVPGGVLVASSSAVVPNTAGKTCATWEFHPSILNTRRFFNDDYNDEQSIFYHDLIWKMYHDASIILPDERRSNMNLPSSGQQAAICIDSSYDNNVYLGMTSQMVNFNPAFIRDKWISVMNHYDKEANLSNDPETGHLKPADDETLRQNILCNIAIFSLFLLSFSYARGQGYALNTTGGTDISAVESDRTVWENFWYKNKRVGVSNNNCRAPSHKNNSQRYGYSITINNSNGTFTQTPWDNNTNWREWIDGFALMWFVDAVYCIKNDVSPTWVSLITSCDDTNKLCNDASSQNVTLAYFTFDQTHLSGLSDPHCSLLGACGCGFSHYQADEFNLALCIYDISEYSNDWAILVPKYNAETFMFYVIAAAVVTAVAVAVTVVAVVGFNKWRRNIAIKQTRDVDSAWSAYAESGSEADRKSYYKAVRKNNMCRWLTGNSRYSKTNYWAGDVSASGDAGGASDSASKYEDLKQLYSDSSALYQGDIVDDNMPVITETEKMIRRTSNAVDALSDDIDQGVKISLPLLTV